MIMKMSEEQKVRAIARRKEQCEARRRERLEEDGREAVKQRLRSWGGWRCAIVGHGWNRGLLSAAALVQQSHAAECEAALADDPVVTMRAAAEREEAGKAVAALRAMIAPMLRGRVAVSYSFSDLAETYLGRARKMMDDFPRELVRGIPAWGGPVVERHRKRAFRVGDSLAAGDGAAGGVGAAREVRREEGVMDSKGGDAGRVEDMGSGGVVPLPRDPAVLRELAAVFRWQGQVLSAAADCEAGEAAGAAVLAEWYLVGPVPFEGPVADAVAPMARANKAREEIIEALAVFEQCGSKGGRHAARMLQERFPFRLTRLLPGWWTVRGSRLAAGPAEGLERVAYELAAADMLRQDREAKGAW